MTTAAQAYAVVRDVLRAGLDIPVRWQNENADSNGQVALPSQSAIFAYVDFIVESGDLVSFGGGRGNNRYRNRARADVFVFVPRGAGLTPALDKAEAAAALLRSYRDNDISCFDATVYSGAGSDLAPPGIRSVVTNYAYAIAEISFWFDLIG